MFLFAFISFCVRTKSFSVFPSKVLFTRSVKNFLRRAFFASWKSFIVRLKIFTLNLILQKQKNTNVRNLFFTTCPVYTERKNFVLRLYFRFFRQNFQRALKNFQRTSKKQKTLGVRNFLCYV